MLQKWLPQKREYRRNFIMSVLCALTTSSCLVALPLILSNIIDIIFYKYEFEEFICSIFVYMAVFLLYSCTDYIYTFNWQNLHNYFINKDLKGNIFLSILQLDYKTYHKLKNGKLLSAVTSDADEVLYTIQYNYIQVASNFITMTVMLIILFSIDWVIGCLLICSALVIALSLRIQKQKAEACSKDLHHAKTIFNDWVFKFTKGIPDAKINFTTELIQKIMNREVKDINFFEKKKVVIEGENAAITFITQYVIKISICIYMAVLCSGGEMQLGAFYLVINYLDRIQVYGEFFSDNFQKMRLRKAALDNIANIDNGKEKSEMLQEPNSIERISLKDVEYRKNDSILFAHLSCEFMRGKPAFIQGKSGRGKSTILNLIMKNIDPYGGDILYNGYTADFVNAAWLKKHICYIKQGERLFYNQTIKFNIDLGKDINQEKLIELCKELKIYQDIVNMPKGFETVLNSKNTISDGQVQKILLLRAIFSEKDVYIFDEITSHMDNESAEKAINLIKEYKKDKVLIFVTHDSNIYGLGDVVYTI